MAIISSRYYNHRDFRSYGVGAIVLLDFPGLGYTAMRAEMDLGGLVPTMQTAISRVESDCMYAHDLKLVNDVHAPNLIR
jgi:hypothetical protein